MFRELTFKFQVMFSLVVFLQIQGGKIVALDISGGFNAFNKGNQIPFLVRLVFSSKSLSVCRSGKL